MGFNRLGQDLAVYGSPIFSHMRVETLFVFRYPEDIYDRYWPGVSDNFTNVKNFAGASSVLDWGLAIDEPRQQL